MPPPPDRPTKPLPAVEPVVEREVITSSPLAVEDIRSLRRAVVLLSILAVAATAVAVFALLRADESKEESADRDRVVQIERALDRRVKEVETRLRSTGEETDIRSLERRLRQTGEEADVTQLDRRLRRAEGDTVDAIEAASENGEAIGELENRLDELSQQVQALRADSR